MVGQRILGMMHGHHLLRFQVQGCPGQVIRHQVDILPPLVILSVFKNSQIYTRKAIPDPGKMRVVTTVSRQIYLPGRSFKQKRSPQRFIGRKSPPRNYRYSYLNYGLRFPVILKHYSNTPPNPHNHEITFRKQTESTQHPWLSKINARGMQDEYTMV